MLSAPIPVDLLLRIRGGPAAPNATSGASARSSPSGIPPRSGDSRGQNELPQPGCVLAISYQGQEQLVRTRGRGTSGRTYRWCGFIFAF